MTTCITPVQRVPQAVEIDLCPASLLALPNLSGIRFHQQGLPVHQEFQKLCLGIPESFFGQKGGGVWVRRGTRTWWGAA